MSISEPFIRRPIATTLLAAALLLAGAAAYMKLPVAPLPRGILIRALCPHAEAMSYDADLRSLTQGVGYFTMTHSHYDPVPPPIAQKIIEKRRAEGKVKGIEE